MNFIEYLKESTFRLTPQMVDVAYDTAKRYDFEDNIIHEVVVKSIYDVLREMQSKNLVGRRLIWIDEAINILRKYAKKCGHDEELKKYEHDDHKCMVLMEFFSQIYNVVR